MESNIIQLEYCLTVCELISVTINYMIQTSQMIIYIHRDKQSEQQSIYLWTYISFLSVYDII